jgi:hypothetical protein
LCPLQSLLHKSQEPVQKAINFAGRKAGCSPQPLQASRRERESTRQQPRTTTGKCIYPSTSTQPVSQCWLRPLCPHPGRAGAACVCSLCAHSMETAAAAHMSAAVGKKNTCLHSQQTKSCSLMVSLSSSELHNAHQPPAAAERSQRRANGFFIFRLSLVAFCDWHTGNASHPCVMIICTLHLRNAIVFLSLSFWSDSDTALQVEEFKYVCDFRNGTWPSRAAWLESLLANPSVNFNHSVKCH